MLGYILELTSNLLSRAKNISEKEKKLLKNELNFSINQTRTHISNFRNNGADRASGQLSNIWRRAGLKLQAINNPELVDLAKTIEEKSKYWADPISYDKDDLEKNEMYLSQVEHKLKEITQ